MTRYGLALLFSLMGCTRGEARPSPVEESYTPAPAPDEERPRPPPLSPEDLEGVLPPRWGVGDEWLVRASTPERDDWLGFVDRMYIYRFRVVAVPHSGAEHYVITVHGGHRLWLYRLVLFVCVPDPALSVHLSDWPAEGLSPSFSEPARPLTGGGSPFFGFPLMPPFLPAAPPRFANGSSFGEERGTLSASQVFVPTKDGLRVTLTAEYLYARSRVELTFRRGDPWWSSARVCVSGNGASGVPASPGEILEGGGDLVRADEPLEPMPAWWLSGPMPSSADPCVHPTDIP
jgi:hypothetical protein